MSLKKKEMELFLRPWIYKATRNGVRFKALKEQNVTLFFKVTHINSKTSTVLSYLTAMLLCGLFIQKKRPYFFFRGELMIQVRNK